MEQQQQQQLTQQDLLVRFMDEFRRDFTEVKVSIGRIEQTLTERKTDIEELSAKLRRHSDELRVLSQFQAKAEKIPEEVEHLKKRQWMFAGAILLAAEIVGGLILWLTRTVP